VRYSRRLPQDLSPTPLATSLAASGRAADAIDLTVSNPTAVGLRYDAAAIAAALADPALLSYTPEPLGLPVARAAVAAYLRRARDLDVPAERIVLTASTSEAYSVLMKLLCDPGDAIAVPTPSYPLVPHLAELEGIRALTYELTYDAGRWRLDEGSLRRALVAGARAVVAISPNNPTGNVFEPAEAARLRAACEEHGAALIADEVFAPYGASGRRLPTLGADGGPLCFVLDGLSKSAALPQLKLGWMVLFGRESEVAQARLRLEWLLDAYLSVGTPVQVAAPKLLETGLAMQEQLAARLTANRAEWSRALGACPGIELLESDGGWYAVLRLPPGTDEEMVVEHLAREAGVLVHPGFFYDFPTNEHLVVSLIAEPRAFAAGAKALGAGLNRLLAGCL
jgi:alanine-synthesizing transaminase